MKIILDEIKTRSPFKDLFTIKSSTLSAITKSMKKDGFSEAEPLVYWQVKGVGHVLIDGHTRLEAAKQAGLATVEAVRMDFDDELKAVEYAISRQKNRRNLTDGEMLSCLDELDKLRQEKGANQHTKKEVASLEATLNKGKSADATAKALGTSRSKIEKARTVQDHADEETIQAVKSGDMSINKAYNETQARRKEESKEEQTEEERGIILNDYASQIVKQLKSKGCTSEEIAYVFSIAKY